ncbi:hypothetical protein NDU88_006420 [Pleurodeles waltl]|uniref:Uncharacterized protein n=1 Tax=Pleurodeles waltl TaxID=8319 RepID=A0AAV7WER9_PLEWA|nr:hypothetical protein NDU88_006420 [Pleurodeles waltl]
MRLPGVGSASTLTCMCTSRCPLGSRCIVTTYTLHAAVDQAPIVKRVPLLCRSTVADRCSAVTDHYLLHPVVCISWSPSLLLPCLLLWAARLPSISVLQVRAGRELSLRSLGARVRSGKSTSAGALPPSITPGHQAMVSYAVVPRPGPTAEVCRCDGQSLPNPGGPSQQPTLSQQCCSPFLCPLKANPGQDQPNLRGSPRSSKESGQVCLGHPSRRAEPLLLRLPAQSSLPKKVT